MIFINSASSAAPLQRCYLPGVCTHTDAEGKQKGQSPEFLNTLYNPCKAGGGDIMFDSPSPKEERKDENKMVDKWT